MAFRARLIQLLVIPVAVVAIGTLIAPAPSTAAGPGFAASPVFGAGGMAQAVFAGGTVEELEAAALAVGANGVWVQASDGSFHLLVVGGPAFLKDAFRARFASGIGVTAVTLSRPEGASAPPAAAPSVPSAPGAPPASTTPAPASAAVTRVVAAPEALPTPPPPGRAVPTPAPSLAFPAPVAAGTDTQVPSPLIEVYGAVRTDSALRFAFDFTRIDTLPALRAGASAAAQQVTMVRMCHAVLDQPEECLDAAAPPIVTVRPGPERYYFAVPPRGSSAVATAQLCNEHGCGGKTVVGVAAMSADGTMYAVGSAYRGASLVRTYRMDTRLIRVRWTYSDGLAAYYGECSVDGCPGSAHDASVAPFAIVDGIGLVGTPLVTSRLLLRGTLPELLRQRLDPAPRGGGPRPGRVPTVTGTSTIEDGGLTARVGSQQLFVVTPVDQDHELVAPFASGGSVALRIPAHALADRGEAAIALVDVLDLASRQAAPSGTEFVAGVHLRARLAARPLDGFDRQVLLDVTIDRSALPDGTSARDLSVVRWDGAGWVPASDSVGVTASGALNPRLWVQANGFYVVVRAASGGS
ncbi:MAG: hypothetical protein AB7G21_03910 [Dehalococcoidia bacterium]